ncbi:hypothetical protein C8Q74DRAFT_109210 [Fomes fomentarius]|nr:hypothetical protein C8Q74DRAFT_109210 [Fomes fomentarius]
MTANSAFLTADIFDALYDTIVHHVSALLGLVCSSHPSYFVSPLSQTTLCSRERYAASLLENPSDINHEYIAIMKAKSSSSQYISLGAVVLQTVLQVAAIAKTLMHGAVTNGVEWMFFTFISGPEYLGGTYVPSTRETVLSVNMRADLWRSQEHDYKSRPVRHACGLRRSLTNLRSSSGTCVSTCHVHLGGQWSAGGNGHELHSLHEAEGWRAGRCNL